MDYETTIQELKELVRNFVVERDWLKYHNPKDLAEAICIEAAELLEVFQWASPEETLSWKDDRSKLCKVEEELADVVIYCLSMANVMGIDISNAVVEKVKKNIAKYPVDKYRGRAHLE